MREVESMDRSMYPVDVISICSAEGEIRPLRLRLQQEGEETVMDITDILRITQIPHVGVEASVYLCRAKSYGRTILFELKYTFRSHQWCLLRRIC